MAAESTTTVSGTLIAAGGGTLAYNPAQIVNTNNVGRGGDPLNLTSIPLLVTLPPNTQWFGIVPPANNTIPITHKWLTGDTGGVIHKTYGIPCLAVDSSNLTFYLSSATNVTVTIWSA